MHQMTLAVDDYGNVRRAVAIGYGRRFEDADPNLTPKDRQSQKQIHLTYTHNQFTTPIIIENDAYRMPMPYQSQTFELLKVKPQATYADITNLFRFDEIIAQVAQASDGAHDIPYEDVNASGAALEEPYRRLIEHTRSLYRKADLTGPHPLGVTDPLALPYENYQVAFTPGLLTQVYGTRVTNTMLEIEGKYVHSEGDANWWIPSGLLFYSPNSADTPQQEQAEAQSHFFLPRRFQDPFGNSSSVTYDTHDLFLSQIRDALQNTVTATNNYRVLQPEHMTDPNGNRSHVAFDTLGMVVGTAVMGKDSENLGDSLANFEADLDDATLNQHINDPLNLNSGNPANDPHELLKQATNRVVYDLFAYHRTKNGADPKPAVVYSLVRETHQADLAQNERTKIQHSFSYSDGFGREIQGKVQAEPGPLDLKDQNSPAVDPRWVGSGWTILNNKGNPVKQYEPFFDDTHEFKFGHTVGVSSTLFYDPAERVVATLYPNHTYEKVVFDPWRQETWDINDTVGRNPKTEDDVKEFFTRLPDGDYLPTWHALRTDPVHAAEATQRWPDPKTRDAEKRAADKASVHAATPSVAYADSLGRTFLTVAHNKFKYSNTPLGDPPVEEFHSHPDRRSISKATSGKCATRSSRTATRRDAWSCAMTTTCLAGGFIRPAWRPANGGC